MKPADIGPLAASALALILGACAAPDLSPRGESPVALAAVPTLEPTPQPQPRFPQRQPMDEERPVKVRSKALRYDNQNQETVFYGGVTVTQDSTTLLAQELRSADGGRNARVSGGVLVTDEARHLWAQAGQADYSDLMREASFSGGLRLLSVDPYGAPLTVTGQEGRYWGLSQAAKVDGGVQVWRGALSATAQSAELDEGGERLRLLGGVIADLGSSRARSREAALGSVDRSLLLTGGVRAHLLPKELRQAAAQPWSITPTVKEAE